MTRQQLEDVFIAASDYIHEVNEDVGSMQTALSLVGEKWMSFAAGSAYYQTSIRILNERIAKIEADQRELRGDISHVVSIYEGKMVGAYHDEDLLHAVELLAQKHGEGAFSVMTGLGESLPAPDT